MNRISVENLKVGDLKHVLLPLKRGRMLKNYVDVGFDTEYTAEPNSEDRELISMQFSLGKGSTAVYYVNRKEGISCEELLEYTLKFLNEQGAEPQKHIFLIAHFAIAELSKINDFYDEYEAQSGFNVRPKVCEFNKAIRWERNFGEITLHIIDLFGHMKTSLEKIGASLGFEKLKIEADGEERAYWITHMKELSEKHRDIFEKYAARDSEIAIEAWRKLVEAYKPLKLDPHVYSTYNSIAIAAFRMSMKRLPCKVAIEEVLLKQKMNGDKWREHVAKKLVYDGDFNVRLLAALAYWGGNNQAFVRGYMPHIDGSYYDFISLYIIAGILQPLSDAETEYKVLTFKDIEDGAEGFAQVDFEFPQSEVYPCLPMKENYYDKLMFTRRGTSYCTLSELRQALEQGANLKKFKGYGFYPEENEIEHDLKPFLIGMLEKKSTFDLTAEGRKSIERQIEKDKMVGVVGRLAYMKPSRLVEDISRLLHESSLSLGKFREYGKKKALRSLTERSEVGGSWHIEWASLIIGKARSLAAWAVRQGEKCLSISTDGGFWLGNPHFENTELHKSLAKFSSGLRFEGEFDELWINRNRCYVAWKNGEVLHSAQGGVAVAGKRSDEKKANFERMIRESLTAEKEVYTEAETSRLTGLNDYIYEDLPLSSEQVKVKKISWKPDFKRKLNNPDMNPFKDYSDTAPYETIAEAFRQAYGIREKAGRPRTKLTEQQVKDILKSGETVRALAKKYDVTSGYIAKLKRHAD